MRNTNRIEYGDWQTCYPLALSICKQLKAQGVAPKVIIEPTCGVGNFILAALEVFDSIEDVYGIEIHQPYLDTLTQKLEDRYKENPPADIHLIQQNVFDFPFNSLTQSIQNRETLILGNPPWITNAQLSRLDSRNLPTKGNFRKNSGIAAMTGKGNFDIGETIFLQMLELMSKIQGHIALLLKNSVIRNIVHSQKCEQLHISDICQFKINAAQEFGASVAASLFFAQSSPKASAQCKIYDFYTKQYECTYGWVGDKFVANTDSYAHNKIIDGKCPLTWRSGVKHDCSKIMELRKTHDKYYNANGQLVDIEDDLVYPLIKSSDVMKTDFSSPRRYILITQHHTSEDTAVLAHTHPKTYAYLKNHAAEFNNRGSRIYNGRPPFSIFGIGDYSFAPYKVIISGLYKHTYFGFFEQNNKPYMADDTCYMLSFHDRNTAKITQSILNHPYTQAFIHSIHFEDAKRVINKDLLERIDLVAAAKLIGCKELNISEQMMIDYIQRLSSSDRATQLLLHLTA